MNKSKSKPTKTTKPQPKESDAPKCPAHFRIAVIVAASEPNKERVNNVMNILQRELAAMEGDCVLKLTFEQTLGFMSPNKSQELKHTYVAAPETKKA